MIYPILIIIALGVAIYWFKRWQALPKNQQQRAGKQFLLWGAVALVFALVVMGRAHWIMGVLAALLAILSRVAQIAQYIPLFKHIFGEAEQGKKHTKAMAQSDMTKQQAAEILGVEVDASEQEISQAYKKLMLKIHPDRGGTDALAKQINQAKDVLLS